MHSIVWKTYALLILGLGLLILPRSLAIGVIYLAIGISILNRLSYARFIAYLPPLLYLLLYLLVAVKPASGVLFSLRAQLFGMERRNFLLSFLLDPLSQQLWLWGFTKTFTKALFFGGVIAILVVAHRRYWSHAPSTPGEQRLAIQRALRAGAWLSGFVVAAGFTGGLYFFCRDLPPWGRNPGGPGGGSLFFLSAFFWGPLILIGGLGLAFCRIAIHQIKKTQPQTKLRYPEGSDTTQPSK